MNWRALAEELAHGHRAMSDKHPVSFHVNREEASAILAALRYAAVSPPAAHVHTCMSCGESWFCPHQPGDCTAPPKVMPSLILRGPSGPTVFHHACKENP